MFCLKKCFVLYLKSLFAISFQNVSDVIKNPKISKATKEKSDKSDENVIENVIVRFKKQGGIQESSRQQNQQKTWENNRRAEGDKEDDSLVSNLRGAEQS